MPRIQETLKLAGTQCACMREVQSGARAFGKSWGGSLVQQSEVTLGNHCR